MTNHPLMDQIIMMFFYNLNNISQELIIAIGLNKLSIIWEMNIIRTIIRKISELVTESSLTNEVNDYLKELAIRLKLYNQIKFKINILIIISN